MADNTSGWIKDTFGLLTRSSLVRIGQQMFVIDGLRAAFVLAGSIVTVRYLGGDLYGAYQFFVAWVAVMLLFVQFWDTGISRFVPTADFDRQVDIVFGVFCCKLVSFGTTAFIAAVVVLAFLSDSPLFLDRIIDPALMTVIVILILELPFAFISSTFNQTLVALQHFRRILIYSLVRAFAVLVWTIFVAIVWVPAIPTGLIAILVGRMAIQVVSTAWLGWTLGRLNPGFFSAFVRRIGAPSAAFIMLREVDYRRYTLPFVVTTLSAYVRDQLPSIALGAYASLNDVAVYRIVASVFQFLFTFFVNTGRFLLPGLVKARNIDADHFDYRFALISSFYLATMAVIAGILLVFNRLLLSIWGLEPRPFVELLFIFIGLNLIVDAAASIEVIGFSLGKDMRRMIPGSVGRAVIQAAIVFALTPSLGLTGPAVGLLAGTTWLYVFMAWSAVKVGARARRYVMSILLQTFALSVLYGLCAYIALSGMAG